MLPRHAISDADWDRIKDLMPGRPGLHGGVAKDNRLFIDAVLYVGRTGIPWADLPERFRQAQHRLAAARPLGRAVGPDPRRACATRTSTC